jgi:hypothetical protein
VQSRIDPRATPLASPLFNMAGKPVNRTCGQLDATHYDQIAEGACACAHCAGSPPTYGPLDNPMKGEDFSRVGKVV